MDEGIQEQILNLVGPQFHICNDISPNQRLSIILHFHATDKSFSDLKFLNAILERAFARSVMETCGEINKILKYNIKVN